MAEEIVWTGLDCTVTTHRCVVNGKTWDLDEIPESYVFFTDESSLKGKALRWGINTLLFFCLVIGGAGVCSDGDTGPGLIMVGIGIALMIAVANFIKRGSYKRYHLYLEPYEQITGYHRGPSTTQMVGPGMLQTKEGELRPDIKTAKPVLSSNHGDLVYECSYAINYAKNLRKGYTLDI